MQESEDVSTSSARVHGHSPVRRLNTARGIVLLLVALAVVFAVRPVFAFCRAISVMYVFNLQHTPKPIRVFRRLANTDTVLTEVVFSGRNGEGRMREYVPRGKENAPVMVLVHGLAPEGRFDHGMNILGQQLSANGFRVLIPEIASERERLMHKDALYDIGDAIHFGRQLNGRPIPVVGVSFGGGLLLRAAALPQYAADVKVVLCIAGYNDLLRLGHFYVGDAVLDPLGNRYPEAPVKDGTMLMAFQYLKEFVTPEQLAAAQEAITSVIGGTDTPAQEAEMLSKLPQATAKRVMELSDGSDPMVHQEMEAMLDRHSSENKFISPHDHLQALRASVYLLHGEYDSSIPVGEATWNCEEIRSAGAKCYVRITPWLHHAKLNAQATLAEKLRVSLFVSRFLNAAAH